VHLRGRENILKRLVVDSGAANLGLFDVQTVRKGHAARPGENTARHLFCRARPYPRLVCYSDVGQRAR
jgi:hypothetical protein